MVVGVLQYLEPVEAVDLRLQVGSRGFSANEEAVHVLSCKFMEGDICLIRGDVREVVVVPLDILDVRV